MNREKLFKTDAYCRIRHFSSQENARPRGNGGGRCCRRLSDQKMNLNPNCMTRALLALALDVTVPKLLELLTSAFGEPKITVLNRLKASARNSTFRASPQSGNPRKTEKSTFQYRCAWKGSGRRLPNVPKAGTAKALALNQQV